MAHEQLPGSWKGSSPWLHSRCEWHSSERDGCCRESQNAPGMGIWRLAKELKSRKPPSCWTVEHQTWRVRIPHPHWDEHCMANKQYQSACKKRAKKSFYSELALVGIILTHDQRVVNVRIKSRRGYAVFFRLIQLELSLLPPLSVNNEKTWSS